MKLLCAYAKAGINLNSFIDGGAGSGNTAMEMAEYLSNSAYIYAFEPFPGNQKFFESLDPRIKLFSSALSDFEGKANFYVSSVVSEDSAWGKKGMAGYSSVGFLSDSHSGQANSIMVDCVRADEAINETEKIGFVKLDLQGGELKALQGMKRILKNVEFMWVEYMGKDHELLDYIV